MAERAKWIASHPLVMSTAVEIDFGCDVLYQYACKAFISQELMLGTNIRDALQKGTE